MKTILIIMLMLTGMVGMAQEITEDDKKYLSVHIASQNYIGSTEIPQHSLEMPIFTDSSYEPIDLEQEINKAIDNQQQVIAKEKCIEYYYYPYWNFGYGHNLNRILYPIDYTTPYRYNTNGILIIY